MKLRRMIMVCLALLLACGCSIKSRYIEKRGVLDESLYFYEQDSSGVTRPISDDGTSFKERKPSRIPQPDLVDMDSMIHVLVAKGRLSPENDRGLLVERSQLLLKRKGAIHQALALLEEIVQIRKKAVDAYHQNLDTFADLKKAFGKAEADFIERLTELWPEGTPEYDALEEAYDPPGFAELQGFLQSQIDGIENADRVIARDLSERVVSLRLEAVLRSPPKDPIAIHLDGYDSIRQGDFQRRDRMGLDLSIEEKERLDAQIKSTQALAAAAERVRKGEISLQYALQETIPLVSDRLGRLLSKIQGMNAKLDDDVLQDRLNRIEQDFHQLIDVFHQRSEALTARIRSDLNEMPQAFRSYMGQESAGYSQILFLLMQIEDLKQRWSRPNPLDYIGLVADSKALLKRLENMSKDLPELSADAMGGLESFLEKSFENMDIMIKNALLQLMESDEARELRVQIEGLYGDLHSIQGLVNGVGTIFDVLTISPVAIGTHAPESILVPYDEIKDTFIDLNYTPRLQGDTITIQATLYDGEIEKDKTTASFQVERFGWFAELSPAVVLVKPDELQGNKDGFRFAPVLSWMHHYVPRPEASSWSAWLMRGLQPALGIHSAFTNFDSEGSNESVQVGLGATVSFWKNRLQFGAGYNLMADSEQEGRYYYFVGTDLIGLLQTVGIGK